MLADQLRRAAGRLIAPHTYRLNREGGAVERVTLPALLDLLSTALASSRSSAAGDAGGAKSKPPIDLGLVDLLTEIDDVVADACREHGLTVRYHWQEIVAGHREVWDGVPFPVRIVPVARTFPAGRDVAGNLRQLVPALIAEGGIELAEWWVEQFETWAVRAEAVIGDREEGQGVVPIPSMTCLDCGSAQVTREEGGETFRSPALVAVVREHEVRMLSCGACGMTWHRGPDLDNLLAGVIRTRAVELGVVRSVDEVAAAAVREWAEPVDDLGWPGSPEVTQHADEIGMFLLDRGLLADRPATVEQADALDEWAREFASLAADRACGRGSWRQASELLATAAAERRTRKPKPDRPAVSA